MVPNWEQPRRLSRRENQITAQATEPCSPAGWHHPLTRNDTWRWHSNTEWRKRSTLHDCTHTHWEKLNKQAKIQIQKTDQWQPERGEGDGLWKTGNLRGGWTFHCFVYSFQNQPVSDIAACHRELCLHRQSEPTTEDGKCSSKRQPTSAQKLTAFIFPGIRKKNMEPHDSETDSEDNGDAEGATVSAQALGPHTLCKLILKAKCKLCHRVCWYFYSVLFWCGTSWQRYQFNMEKPEKQWPPSFLLTH